MKDFLDPTEVLSVLHGFNPWWAGKSVAVPAFQRLAYAACRKYLENPELKRAVLLSGPRRVGKTTVLQQLVVGAIDRGAEPRGLFYVSLDHPILKLLPIREILGLYHAHIHPEGRPALLLLDEVQYSREWETEIKLLVDHRPEYRIVATGSASAVHRDRISESGVGRWITVPVPTLSFYEFARLRGEESVAVPERLRPNDLFATDTAELASVAAALRPMLPSFQRYLLVGGFPETARQDDVNLCQRLLREDVVERVLKRDMTALFGVRNVNELEKLFIYLCLHTGGILSPQAVATALETSKTSVSNYLELLERANLIYSLPPARLGGKRVLRARNKYYLVDAALRNAVLLRGEEVLSNSEEMGTIVETTVLRHLYAYYYRDTPEISYWRDAKTDREVDIIVRSPAYMLPFEVKYRDRAPLDRVSGLAVYCESERVKQAYFVTKADTDFRVVTLEGIDTQFLKVPAHVLCYLLGQAERLLWQ